MIGPHEFDFSKFTSTEPNPLETDLTSLLQQNLDHKEDPRLAMEFNKQLEIAKTLDPTLAKMIVELDELEQRIEAMSDELAAIESEHLTVRVDSLLNTHVSLLRFRQYKRIQGRIKILLSPENDILANAKEQFIIKLLNDHKILRGEKAITLNSLDIIKESLEKRRIPEEKIKETIAKIKLQLLSHSAGRQQIEKVERIIHRYYQESLPAWLLLSRDGEETRNENETGFGDILIELIDRFSQKGSGQLSEENFAELMDAINTSENGILAGYDLTEENSRAIATHLIMDVMLLKPNLSNEFEFYKHTQSAKMFRKMENEAKSMLPFWLQFRSHFINAMTDSAHPAYDAVNAFIQKSNGYTYTPSPELDAFNNEGMSYHLTYALVSELTHGAWFMLADLLHKLSLINGTDSYTWREAFIKGSLAFLDTSNFELDLLCLTKEKVLRLLNFALTSYSEYHELQSKLSFDQLLQEIKLLTSNNYYAFRSDTDDDRLVQVRVAVAIPAKLIEAEVLSIDPQIKSILQLIFDTTDGKTIAQFKLLGSDGTKDHLLQQTALELLQRVLIKEILLLREVQAERNFQRNNHVISTTQSQAKKGTLKEPRMKDSPGSQTNGSDFFSSSQQSHNTLDTLAGAKFKPQQLYYSLDLESELATISRKGSRSAALTALYEFFEEFNDDPKKRARTKCKYMGELSTGDVNVISFRLKRNNIEYRAYAVVIRNGEAIVVECVTRNNRNNDSELKPVIMNKAAKAYQEYLDNS